MKRERSTLTLQEHGQHLELRYCKATEEKNSSREDYVHVEKRMNNTCG